MGSSHPVQVLSTMSSDVIDSLQSESLKSTDFKHEPIWKSVFARKNISETELRFSPGLRFALTMTPGRAYLR